MKLRIAIALVIFTLTMSVAPPMYAPGLIVETTYYSDYFETVAGWNISDTCEECCFYDAFGTQDGAYRHVEYRQCGAVPNGNEHCYENVNGAWQSIDCPPWFD